MPLKYNIQNIDNKLLECCFKTATPTPTISVTPTITPTITVTPTITPTISVTPTITPTSIPNSNNDWIHTNTISGNSNFDLTMMGNISLNSEGTVIAISSPFFGITKVYALNPVSQSWTQKGDDILGSSNENSNREWPGAHRGLSLSADGNTLAIGSTLYSSSNINSSITTLNMNDIYMDPDGMTDNTNDYGKTSIYFWNGTNWIQKGNNIIGEFSTEKSGRCVKLSSDGNTVAISAQSANNDAGVVRIYYWNGNSWIKKGNNINGDYGYDFFGSHMSMNSDGSVIVASAPSSDNLVVPGNIINDGAVKVYYWTGMEWAQRGDTIRGEYPSDYIGFFSVAINSSGDTIAFSSFGGTWQSLPGPTGFVKVYTWNGNAWIQKGSQISGDAQTGTTADHSGWQISFNNDGNKIAIGSIGYNEYTGKVKVYEWKNNDWQQLGSTINGELPIDLAGYRVELNNIGNTLAILNRQSSSNNPLLFGKVKIYNYSTYSNNISSTPTPTPTKTPGNSASNNVLFDTSSWQSIVTEPYLTWLNAAVDRWSTYLRYNNNIVLDIQSLYPNWQGLYLNTFVMNNIPSTTIASCGPFNVVYGENANGSNLVLLNSVNFNLIINDYHRNDYSENDWINILTHELGHALGIGIFWHSDAVKYGGIVPTNFFLDGQYYNIAQNAYNNITSTTRNLVPVEDTGGQGTINGHWENNYRDINYVGGNNLNYPGLNNELMVGTISPGNNRILSLLSIKALVGFGYEEINPDTSEGIPALSTSSLTTAQNIQHLECSCADYVKNIIFIPLNLHNKN